MELGQFDLYWPAGKPFSAVELSPILQSGLLVGPLEFCGRC